jgi:hypothetical protein
VNWSSKTKNSSSATFCDFGAAFDAAAGSIPRFDDADIIAVGEVDAVDAAPCPASGRRVLSAAGKTSWRFASFGRLACDSVRCLALATIRNIGVAMMVFAPIGGERPIDKLPAELLAGLA